MELFNASLYISISICVFGIIFRISKWFAVNKNPMLKMYLDHPPLHSGINPQDKTSMFMKIKDMVQTIIIETFFQRRIFKTDRYGWAMHLLVFYGFMFLVVFHAMDDLTSAYIWPTYASTLHPFLLLRNLFGVMVLIGLTMAIRRRIRTEKKYPITNTVDQLTLLLLCGIIFSGFLLESTQIISKPIFDEMVEEYMGSDDPEELDPLKGYWAKEFYVPFEMNFDFSDTEFMEAGLLVHEDYCAGCHTTPKQAFVSLPLAKVLSPFSHFFNKHRADQILRAFHYLLCFFALAYLPFSKFFHIISAPIQYALAHTGLNSKNRPSPDGIKRIIGFDACTHCGQCSQFCSVSAIFQIMENKFILPSEKLSAFRNFNPEAEDKNQLMLDNISEGNYICTECYKCSLNCPSSINLQDLWITSKSITNTIGYPDVYSWISQKSATDWVELQETTDIPLGPVTQKFHRTSMLHNNPETYVNCVQCSICTNVCPVIALADNNTTKIDITPQQVMNLLRLELTDLALGSSMVWNCTTCYMCQEHCPQGILIAEVMYELRNLAYHRFRPLKHHQLKTIKTDPVTE